MQKHRLSLLSAALVVRATFCFDVAHSETLFVADTGSGNIYEFTMTGERSTFASGLSNPHGMVCNSGGDLYVGGLTGAKIDKFRPDGVQSTFASPLGSIGLALDSSENVFAADPDMPRFNSGWIEKITPTGIRTNFASLSNPPLGAAFDPAGNLFVTTGFGNIYKFTAAGASNLFASGLSSPGLPAFDTAGNLFVPSCDGNIYRFTPTAVKSTFATGLDCPLWSRL